ncbi:DUF1010 domain-containing protein [Curvibacter soli]
MPALAAGSKPPVKPTRLRRAAYLLHWASQQQAIAHV